MYLTNVILSTKIDILVCFVLTPNCNLFDTITSMPIEAFKNIDCIKDCCK